MPSGLRSLEAPREQDGLTVAAHHQRYIAWPWAPEPEGGSCAEVATELLFQICSCPVSDLGLTRFWS